jgi:flavin-binding protein dodecin
MGGSVYKIIEVIGSSPDSWEAAAKVAVDTVAGRLSDIRVAEVVQQDIRIDENEIVQFRTKLRISFKYHGNVSA